MQSFEHLRESAISLLTTAKKELILEPYIKAVDEDIQKLDKADTVDDILRIVEYRTQWAMNLKEMMDEIQRQFKKKGE